ncbi:MAG: hypothetical protein ACHQUC_01310 [Chlamydiales bacterium]
MTDKEKIREFILSKQDFILNANTDTLLLVAEMSVEWARANPLKNDSDVDQSQGDGELRSRIADCIDQEIHNGKRPGWVHIVDICLREAARQHPIRGEVSGWREGCPDKVYGSEWFIAKLTNGSKVVLRELPEEFSYDYRTLDETYFKKELIKCWMQFPDSDFIPYESKPTQRELKLVEALDGLVKVAEELGIPRNIEGFHNAKKALSHYHSEAKDRGDGL